MDKPISVGDLVVVVTECCGHEESHLGEYHIVQSIGREESACSHCGDSSIGLVATLGKCDDGTNDDWGLPARWLKRIPPLGELEGEKRDEKLTEPA